MPLTSGSAALAPHRHESDVRAHFRSSRRQFETSGIAAPLPAGPLPTLGQRARAFFAAHPDGPDLLLGCLPFDPARDDYLVQPQEIVTPPATLPRKPEQAGAPQWQVRSNPDAAGYGAMVARALDAIAGADAGPSGLRKVVLARRLLLQADRPVNAATIAARLGGEARVLLQENAQGRGQLVAYVVPSPGFTEASLRRHFAEHLPDYMVPAAIVPLVSLPLTANGKLDRAALPAPRFTAAPSRPPAGPTEQLLARLFAETLGLATPPGADADFFALGGDSLAAVSLLLGVRAHLGEDPGLGALFAHPTIAGLAALLERQDAAPASALGPTIMLGHGDMQVPPVFAIHPAGGLAWCYRALAQHLGPARGVIGLQAPALDPAAPLPDSLQALAADYAGRISALDTPGPIHLLGWSVGGLITQAMAVHLAEQGREIGLVALLDAYPAECWRAEPEPDPVAALRALLALAGHDPIAHPELTTRAAIVAFLRTGNSPLAALPEAALDGVIRVVTQTNFLVRNHYHHRYNGTLTHVRAALDHQGRSLHPEQWTPHAAALDRIDVPFLHAQLTGAAATAALAPQLVRRLDAIDRKG